MRIKSLLIRPFQPLRMPTQSMPRLSAARTTPRPAAEDRFIVFLLRRRYLLMALAIVLAAVMFAAACLPDFLM